MVLVGIGQYRDESKAFMPDDLHSKISDSMNKASENDK